MNYYVFFVAITASIDSFFCGVSLVKKEKFYIKSIKIIFVVFVMCLFANYLGKYFFYFFNFNTDILGGSLFVLIAFLQLSIKEEHFSTAFLLGFAIGIDASCANFSLAIMGYNSFIVPLILTFFHYLFLVFGHLVSNTKNLKIIRENKLIPFFVFIFLGIYKIVSSFL